jgi:hypothetical protein
VQRSPHLDVAVREDPDSLLASVNQYLNTKSFPTARGDYKLLTTVDAHRKQLIAVDADVVPGPDAQANVSSSFGGCGTPHCGMMGTLWVQIVLQESEPLIRMGALARRSRPHISTEPGSRLMIRRTCRVNFQ